MGSLPPTLRRTGILLVLLLAASSCSARPHDAGAGPLTAEISQFRDNYSRQIIEIQLTNTTAEPITVLAAGVRSQLFASAIGWSAADAGTELPPGQTKSLSARLPAAACPGHAAEQDLAADPPAAAVEVLLAPAAGVPGRTVTTGAADPFGVLPRNNGEMCVAQAAAEVAGFRFGPELELSPDARSAVLRLVITPRHDARPAGALTINSVGGTTLLAEDGRVPWPVGLRIDASGPAREVRLGVRPARCDPHAVAEDKVGTLIPVRITVAGRDGVLKVGAGAQLRGRIYEFITSACGRQ